MDSLAHNIHPTRRGWQHARNFPAADKLRAELRELGVHVNDKARTYRIMGAPAAFSGSSVSRSAGTDPAAASEGGAPAPPEYFMHSASAAARHGYTRDPIDDLSVELSAEDEEAMHQRIAARRDALRASMSSWPCVCWQSHR